LANSARRSQAIANALASYLRELGGTIRTNHRVENLSDLPKSPAVLLDVFCVGIFCASPAGNCRRRTGIDLNRFNTRPGSSKLTTR